MKSLKENNNLGDDYSLEQILSELTEEDAEELRVIRREAMEAAKRINRAVQAWWVVASMIDTDDPDGMGDLKAMREIELPAQESGTVGNEMQASEAMENVADEVYKYLATKSYAHVTSDFDRLTGDIHRGSYYWRNFAIALGIARDSSYGLAAPDKSLWIDNQGTSYWLGTGQVAEDSADEIPSMALRTWIADVMERVIVEKGSDDQPASFPDIKTRLKSVAEAFVEELRRQLASFITIRKSISESEAEASGLPALDELSEVIREPETTIDWEEPGAFEILARIHEIKKNTIEWLSGMWPVISKHISKHIAEFPLPKMNDMAKNYLLNEFALVNNVWNNVPNGSTAKHFAANVGFNFSHFMNGLSGQLYGTRLEGHYHIMNFDVGVAFNHGTAITTLGESTTLTNHLMTGIVNLGYFDEDGPRGGLYFASGGTLGTSETRYLVGGGGNFAYNFVLGDLLGGGYDLTLIPHAKADVAYISRVPKEGETTLSDVEK